MDTTGNHNEKSKQTNVGAFDSNNMQCLVIVKRLKSLALVLNLLAEESGEDILNTNLNTRTKLTISSFWSCHAHSSCADCEVCCSCVLKMFVEMHLLSERDNVGDNYVAVSNIINGLMRKLAYQNELQKKRKEAEEKKKIEARKREKEGKSEPSFVFLEQVPINWPDDLTDLIDNWDNLPENQGKNMIKHITSSEIEQLLRSIMEPVQPIPIHSNQVMRGWPLHRQTMIARPLISQVNNRAFINRTVIPRPIITQPISTGGRPLMSHIVSGGRNHHFMSQIVSGRPILSRVISGHSLMGHMVTAQSLMNHTNVGNRNVIHSSTSNMQLLQNHMPRQLNHNLTFVNYSPTLHHRSTDHHGSNSNKKSN